MTRHRDISAAQNDLRSAAFTLLEVMVVVVLISFGLVAVLHSFQSAVTAIGVAGERVQADLEMSEILADLERQAALSSDGFPVGYRVEQDGDLYWTTDIQLVGTSAHQKSYQVGLTLWWNNGYRKYAVATRMNTVVRP